MYVCMYLCVIVYNSTKQARINLWLLFISANRRPLGLYRGTSNTSNLAARPAVVPLGPWEGSTMWDQDSARFNPSLIVTWEITIFNGKIHYKWSFSIAMLNYQRVTFACFTMADFCLQMVLNF